MRLSGKAALLCVSIFALSSCRGLPTGPSLSKLDLTYATQATTANASACCCRVIGTATNRNSEVVHVTIKFTALDANDAEISRVLYFIKDFQSGASHQINAAGFVFPCASVAKLTAEVEVRGVTSPGM